MSPFRRVHLPGVPGELYLHSMPGREEPLAEFTDRASGACIEEVLSLSAVEEIERRSPEYARALKDGLLPFRVSVCGIADFGVPSDKAVFSAAVSRAAELLTQGGILLVHCGAGIGRTGMAAACILRQLGMGCEAALAAVNSAGSGPETPEQMSVVVTWSTPGAPRL